ncbi:F-box protein At1g67340-like [Wolffia australiana]
MVAAVGLRRRVSWRTSLPRPRHLMKKRNLSRWIADCPKKPRAEPPPSDDLLSAVPDDVLVSVLCLVSSAAASPADLAAVILTCKRLRALFSSPPVLARASPGSLAVRAAKWSPSAHLFLKACADAGNLHACYALGMIRFYCLPGARRGGAAMMARAAIGAHAAALYSLAVIQFNGSGGSKADKNLRAGVALCARAAFLGHVDALRELGHCLQDGYGVRRHAAEGRRFLARANSAELLAPGGCAGEVHPANRFLLDWFAGGAPGGARLCAHAGCGRPETRQHEFRRCSVCGAAVYCSRACQALDWKLRHRRHCAPLDQLGGPAA